MPKPETPSNNGEEPNGVSSNAPSGERRLTHEDLRPLFYFVHRLESLFFSSPELQAILEEESLGKLPSMMSAPTEQLSRSAERTPYFVEGKALTSALLELANNKASRQDFLVFRAQLERFLWAWAGKKRKPVMVLRNKRPAWGSLKTPLPAEDILEKLDAALEEVFRK